MKKESVIHLINDQIKSSVDSLQYAIKTCNDLSKEEKDKFIWLQAKLNDCQRLIFNLKKGG